MNVTELIERRRQSWNELDQLCGVMSSRTRKGIGSRQLARFASLYRAACADLALAEAWQLPPDTVRYLHNLVGRAHNQLYKSRRLDPATWYRVLFYKVPRVIFCDPYVILGFFVFFGIFLLSAYVAYDPERSPEFAENVCSAETLEGCERSHSNSTDNELSEMNILGTAGYQMHNTSIGMQCYTGGLLGFPGLLITIFNGAYIGAIFGYMARPDVAADTHFFAFVTAHGPFELTAIALSAGAGLRLGGAWIDTKGLARDASLFKTSRATLPVVGTIIILFGMAAVIEGCISPTAIPYIYKALIAGMSTVLLILYFVVLGFIRWRQGPEAE